MLAEPVPAVWEWTVEDHTAPETTIESTPAAEIALDTPALFTFSSNEPDATFECALDPTPVPEFTECAGPPPNNTAEFTGLLAGEHTLLVRADRPEPERRRDARRTSPGRSSARHSRRSPPPCRRLRRRRRETTATFTFAANQPDVTFACSLDGDVLQAVHVAGDATRTCSSAATPSRCRSTNRFGLIEEPPASYEWTIGAAAGRDRARDDDRDRPGEPEHERHARPSRFFADQVGSTFKCSLDAGPVVDCTSPATYPTWPRACTRSTSAPRAPRATPRPRPRAGSGRSTCRPRRIIDTKPPSLTQSTHRAASTSRPTRAARASSARSTRPTSAPARTRYELAEPARRAAHDCASARWTRSSTPDPTPVATRWTIGPSPETTITDAPDDPTESTDATFTFISNLAGVTFECALDEAADAFFFTPCASGVTYTDLGLGDHVLLVRAATPPATSTRPRPSTSGRSAACRRS